jgi:hypothetical protein
MIDEKFIKRLKEEYRKGAFPKGGAKTIKTRDQQNRALVCRGGFRCCEYLLEEIQRRTVSLSKRQRQ